MMMMMMSGVTAVLTLSAISMDSRSDLPKVHYATALDWFIIISFLYCLASILEFAGVHYFTKVLPTPPSPLTVSHGSHPMISGRQRGNIRQ